MNGIKQFRKNKQGFLLVDAMIGVLVVAIGGQTGKGCTDSIGEN